MREAEVDGVQQNDDLLEYLTQGLHEWQGNLEEHEGQAPRAWIEDDGISREVTSQALRVDTRASEDSEDSSDSD